MSEELETETDREIGARLRLFRETSGWTQQEAATRFGVSKTTWQRHETGLTPPKLGTLAAIVAAGCDSNWLLTGKGSMRVTEADLDARLRDMPPLMQDVVMPVIKELILFYAKAPYIDLDNQTESWWRSLAEQFINGYAFRWGMYRLSRGGKID